MNPKISQEEATQEANNLIAEDKVKEMTQQVARADIYHALAGYAFLRFIPGLNIYYNYKLLSSVANYQNIKYGRSKGSLYAGFVVAIIICFLIITFAIPFILSRMNLPVFSYVILFLLTLVVIFYIFEKWIKSNRP